MLEIFFSARGGKSRLNRTLADLCPSELNFNFFFWLSDTSVGVRTRAGISMLVIAVTCECM